MDYKVFFGLLAIVISLVGYFVYVKNIFADKTRPHAFSWLIWSLVTGIEFAGQVAGGAGAGSWVTGVTLFVCFAIFVLALKKGRREISPLDWASFIGALVAIGLWLVTKNPLASVLLATGIDALGFFPTFRKSYWHPLEETLFTYSLNGLKFVFALIALTQVSVLTALYPAYLVIANWAFVVMVLIRRKQLAHAKIKAV